MEKIRQLLFHKEKRTKSMQMTISVSFTVLSVCCMCFLGVMLYQQFTKKAENLTVENSRQLLNQTTINLEDYLRNMRRISDAMYYTVIKNTDIGSESLEDSMTLLYESNKDKLVSIACYTNDGNLTAASPIANTKSGIDVTSQKWFQDAVGELENFHFSMCNSCFLVNLEYVERVDGYTVTVMGNELQISHPRKKQFLKELSLFLGK